uniref:Uncharacterized protein n=1 Tax=Wuchereria bancrofti TaxID=6293 RepID=A0AAF5PQB2_WUCBA
MPETGSSKVTSSSTIDSVSREWKEKPHIPTNISRDDAVTDDIVPELCSAAEQAINFNLDEYFQAFYSIPTKDVAMHTILFFFLEFCTGFQKKFGHCSTSELVCVPYLRFPFKFIFQNWSQNLFKVFLLKENNFRLTYTLNQPSNACITNSDDIPQQFHVVVSIFCLEYSSENLESYRHAVRSAVNLIEPNGFLIQGGVLQANDYYFGNKRYRCHHLTKEQVVESLKENNMAVEKEMTSLK